jgi:hypothetical protein
VRLPRLSGEPLADDAMATPEPHFVFVHWAWSGQSSTGLELLTNVVSPSGFVVIQPDANDHSSRWLTRETERIGLPLHDGGHGSLLYVVDDSVVSFLPRVHEHSAESLGAWLSAHHVG